ncbi:hypothetical protein QE152_g24283 [Popillia japonica]|uniref:Uncharacterized protein n=1 Tax=Popillia japonica TaxID=7064 RepID=A0AAW1KGI6_POPJA
MAAPVRSPKKQTPVSSLVRPGKSYSHVAASTTWTQSQIQKRSATPKTDEKPVKAKTRTPRSVLKKAQNPAPTNISAMLDVLQAMSQQINMLSNIMRATFPNESLKDRK